MVDTTDAPVIRLVDTASVSALADVRRVTESVLERGPGAVVVDLSGAAARPSSTMIAALLWVKRRCAERGAAVLVRSASSECLDTLRRVGLMDAANVEDATSSPAPRAWWPPHPTDPRGARR
jgi:hypothetical protein